MKYCNRCSRYLAIDQFRFVAATGRYYSLCRECETASRRRSSTTRVTRINRGRAFGVEFELTGPSSSRIVRALTEIGIHVVTRNYAPSSGANWELKTDGSVAGHGLELVSPKLYGQEGLDEIARVLTAVNSVGASVDRSCGLHVHIDFRNKTIAQIRKAILPIVRSQEFVYKLCAPSRRGNHYCPSWSSNDIAMLESTNSIQYVQNCGPRGVVNFGSYPRHGSVEFRSHGGSTNPKKVIAWIKFLMSACEWGENTTVDAMTCPIANTPFSPSAMLNALRDQTRSDAWYALTTADVARLLRFETAAEQLEVVENERNAQDALVDA